MFGLVLEGGGAKGAFHIGAYKALLELGLDIKGVAGTSVGAINGAMFVQGDYEKAYNLWYNIKPSDIFDIDGRNLDNIKKLNFRYDNFLHFINIVKTIIQNKGLDTSKIKKILEDNIDENKIRKSDKEFGIVTISVSDYKPLEIFKNDIPKGKLINYLMASANLPIFKTQLIEGKKFIDGGLYDNCPVNMLVQKGFENIVVIRTFGIGRIRNIHNNDINIIEIKPSSHLSGTLDFDNEYARQNIKMGYYDTIKHFRNLKGNIYYIYPEKNIFEKYFLNLNKEKIEKIGAILGIRNIPYKRMLFEFIIPRLTNLLDINKKRSYEDIFIIFIEKAADYINIERFHIYKLDELINKILEEHNKQKDSLKNNTETRLVKSIIELIS